MPASQPRYGTVNLSWLTKWDGTNDCTKLTKNVTKTRIETFRTLDSNIEYFTTHRVVSMSSFNVRNKLTVVKWLVDRLFRAILYRPPSSTRRKTLQFSTTTYWKVKVLPQGVFCLIIFVQYWLPSTITESGEETKLPAHCETFHRNCEGSATKGEEVKDWTTGEWRTVFLACLGDAQSPRQESPQILSSYPKLIPHFILHFEQAPASQIKRIHAALLVPTMPPSSALFQKPSV